MAQLQGRHHFSASFPLAVMQVRQGAILPHSHDFWEMAYIRHGRGEHLLDGRRTPLQPGDLFVLRPGEEHAYAPRGEALQIVNVLWMPSLIEDALQPDSLLQGARRLHLSGRMAYRVELLLDEMRHEQGGRAPGRELLLRHLFCALLVLLSRALEEQRQPHGPGRASNPTAASETVRCAIAWIEEHFDEPLRVSDLAGHVGLSASRLSHLFKQHTGRGVTEYLHEFRIARAGELLLLSDAPVAAIARETGYGDARFFHRMFRRYTGCNPTQFRSHCAGQETAKS